MRAQPMTNPNGHGGDGTDEGSSSWTARFAALEAQVVAMDMLQGERRTHRATLWQRDPAGWKILFHQGTVVEDEDEDPES